VALLNSPDSVWRIRILQKTPAKWRWAGSNHPDSLGDGGRLGDFPRRSLGEIGVELRAELGHVVGEERDLMAGAGDGEGAKSRIEQIRVDAGIGVDQDALGCELLGDGEALDSAGAEEVSR